MSLINSALAHIGVGRLGQNATYGSVGLGARAVIQAGYLVLLSRWMGSQGYGLFAGSVAAIMLVAPLSGWGVSYALSLRVARDRTVSRALWATALIQVLITGAALAAVVVVAAALGMRERVGVLSLVLLSAAELIVLPMAQACSSLCFALDRGMPAAIAICLVPAGRLLVALAWFGTSAAGTPAVVALSHFGGSVVGVIGALVLVAHIDGWPAWGRLAGFVGVVRSGTAYAVGAMVGTSYMEVDKVLMLELLGAAVVGPYTAAFRVASVFALPVSALMSAALPRLFASRGGAKGRRTLKAIVFVSLGYGVVAMVAAVVVSPLLPDVFGASFTAAPRYLVWLAPWPLLFALHQAVATGLTGFDHQRARVVIESTGLALVIAVNAGLLKVIGAGASVLALLAAEAFMALACWIALHALKKHGAPR